MGKGAPSPPTSSSWDSVVVMVTELPYEYPVGGRTHKHSFLFGNHSASFLSSNDWDDTIYCKNNS